MVRCAGCIHSIILVYLIRGARRLYCFATCSTFIAYRYACYSASFLCLVALWVCVCVSLYAFRLAMLLVKRQTCLYELVFEFFFLLTLTLLCNRRIMGIWYLVLFLGRWCTVRPGLGERFREQCGWSILLLGFQIFEFFLKAIDWAYLSTTTANIYMAIRAKMRSHSSSYGIINIFTVSTVDFV